MKGRTEIRGLVSVVGIAVLAAASTAFAQVINVDINATVGTKPASNYTGGSANGPIASDNTWNYFTTSGAAGNNITVGGVTITLGSGWASYGDGSPNNLQGDRIYSTTSGTLTISGLIPSRAYNIAMITGFYSTGAGSTDFTIGATTLTATGTSSAGSNANGPLTFSGGVTHVLFSNVIADGSGAITVTVTKGGSASFGVLCGLQIVTSVSGPAMYVTGNGLSIADGDVSPSTADHTDFGSTVESAGTVVRTFTIHNIGTAPLSLTGTPVVAVSGAHAGDFTVTLDPASSIAAGTSTIFQVAFDPSDLGLRTATLSIANNDSDKNPYDFAIQGVGISPPISSFDDFSTDPNIGTEWTQYNYFNAPTASATWNSGDQDLDLVKLGGDGGVGWYRTDATRLPTDAVTMTVRNPTGTTAGSFGFVGLMITAAQQQPYLTGTGDSYSISLSQKSGSLTEFKFVVTRTYADGNPDYTLYSGPFFTLSGDYKLDIVRNGDDYEFYANDALLYTTASPAAGDFYDGAAKDSMIYYQAVMVASYAMNATVDNFGVPRVPPPVGTVISIR